MENAYNINVDSALRSSGTISDFTFQTTQNKYIQSKAKVAVAAFSWTNSFYQINSTNNTLNFTVVTNNGTVTNNYYVTIPEGNYTHVELLSNVTTRMNSQTVSNNTSIPVPYYNNITYKANFRKYTPGESGALAGEIVGIYNLLPTSTIKSALGFDSTFSFGNTFVEMPFCINTRPIDYFYLTSPNVQSSNYAANIGGNGILFKVWVVAARNNNSVYENDNINDSLMDCSYIPMQWSFRLVDKYGQTINMLVPFSFTLRILPE